ncbi:hypothetical protein [Bacillus sp. BP-3]|uniref:hypothetical protein n=1 Tax=Bacillus sp. BP-3 TaxID=3022773 RepID=UPI00232C01B9|nr:hypothetical protein [Bacillus sp. BP-3]MDC2863998.1 hypothetical protein [Bacillus sp. BP-3]
MKQNEKHISVLEKVKGLLLLPNTFITSTREAAGFFGVDEEAIVQLVEEQQKEFVYDGYMKTDKSACEYSGVLTKRSMLRLACLLDNSEVAIEVRNQLLNIESKM